MNIPTYKWVENDPYYINDTAVAILPSKAVLCFITPVHTWPWSTKAREYKLQFGFKLLGSPRPIGGYYKTIEEAKQAADRMVKQIFGEDELYLAKK